MLILHSSNKAENLFLHLNHILSEPLTSVFKKEIFLTQSKGTERWLCQNLTQQNQLFANFEFIFPNLFFSQLSTDLLINTPPKNCLEKDQLLWVIESYLNNNQIPELNVLKSYLTSENSGLKRYQLAQKMAFLLEQYQFMRPDWIEAWQRKELISSHPAEIWQAALWRQLVLEQQLVSQSDRYQETIEILKKADSALIQAVCPERLNVFGINALSPLYLEILYQLSHHIPVHFYLLNPCESYWADIGTKKQLAMAEQPLIDEETANELLVAYGGQGQDFQSLLLVQTEFDLEYNSFESVESNTLLAHLQNDILFNLNKKQADFVLDPEDNSLQIHSCHSAIREVEVLKDQILDLLAKDAELDLRDILIMAPDIAQYAPFISAVFTDIPHALADQSISEQNKLLQLFLRFINLTQSRLSWQSCFELLEEPIIYQSFNLSEADLALISHWISETGIRWGADQNHRKSLGLPAFKENTWEAGFEQLLMGLAVSDNQQFYQDILPFSEIEGQQSQVLAHFYYFFQFINQARQNLSKPVTLKEWHKKIQYYINALFSAETIDQNHKNQLNQLISELEDFYTLNQGIFSLDIVLAWLQQKADSEKTPQGLLRGQITFCNLLPMRAIPFKVIAILGLNEGDFPKVEQFSAFDLMQQDFRKGDRSRLNDERYQFLEILLSSRETLLLSYIGQSIKTNESQAPSVAISELLDYLNIHYKILPEKIIVQHPLQAFNHRYFNRSSPLFSYSKLALETAKQRQKQIQPKPICWWSEINELSIPEINHIYLADFLAFFKNPQRWFVERQLQFSPLNINEMATELEVFELDSLDNYLLNQAWVEYYLKAETTDFYKRINAQGRWFLGTFGKIAFQQRDKEIKIFAAEILDLQLGNALKEQNIDVTFGKYRLFGKNTCAYEKGNLLYRYSDLKGKDMVNAWIIHLLGQKPTWLHNKDQQKVFKPLEQGQAQPYLQSLVDLYITGLTRPSAFFIEPAKIWADKTNNLQLAQAKYSKDVEYEQHWQALYQQTAAETLLNQDFEAACEAVFTPMYQHLEK